MNPFLEKIYNRAPNFVQNLGVTWFDLQYRKRRGGRYQEFKAYYQSLLPKSADELRELQRKRLREFLAQVEKNSPYYRKRWAGVPLSEIQTPGDLRRLPTVTKEEIRQNIESVATVKSGNAYVGHTGGTTGKSLTTYYTWEDMQERMAILDCLREPYGYRLGEKIAWFSGKNILTGRDERKKRFWKTSLLYNIRYYSTFHLSEEGMPRYLEDLNRFQPRFFSGFASNIFELAHFAQRKNFPVQFKLNAIFTTAEALVPEQVALIEKVFKTKVVDHYSSSEGAPWILQCGAGKYHFWNSTGVIEIENGEMVVTAFGTRGTPLVRYKIGDGLVFAPEGGACACGSHYPVVERIDGRINDFLYSRERGKINLGNVSNCVKYSKGVVQFQVVQKKAEEIEVSLAIDPLVFKDADEAFVVQEFRNRLGDKVAIKVRRVKEIPREKSGKFRIVKNELTGLP